MKKVVNVCTPIVAFLLFVCFAQLNLVAAATIPPVNTLTDAGDGTCDVAECTLREAVALANSDAALDTITFAVNGTILLGSEIQIQESVIISGNGKAETIVDGQGTTRIFVTQNTNNEQIELRGLTVQNGIPGNGDGGAMRIDGAHLTLSNVDVLSSTANNGGGIFHTGTDGSITILDESRIHNNEATGSSSGNGGGGIYVDKVTVTVENSSISYNRAASRGGGIDAHNTGANVLLTETDVEHNTARFGAGVYLENGTISINESSLSHNNSTQDGGGVYINNSGANTQFSGGCFYNNTAVENGGGVYRVNGGLTLQNGTYFANNTAAAGAGMYWLQREQGQLKMDGMCVSQNGGLANEGSDPMGPAALYLADQNPYSTGDFDISNVWWGTPDGPSYSDSVGDGDGIGQNDGGSNNNASTINGAMQVEPFAEAVLATCNVTCEGIIPTQYDYGDLPNYFKTLIGSNGPQHETSIDLYIGAGMPLGSSNGMPDMTASADSSDDGTASDQVLTQGESADFLVTVFNDTGADATLYAWVDTNGDWIWQADEMVSVIVSSSTDPQQIMITGLPVVETASYSFPVATRFRLSSDSNLDFTGPAPDGEVEDFMFTAAETLAVGLTTVRSERAFSPFILLAFTTVMLASVVFLHRRSAD